MKENQLYHFMQKINVPNNILVLPMMYWVPKMHKNSVNFRFIVASTVCIIKPLSKYNINFCVISTKSVKIHKVRIWSGINNSWNIPDSPPVISDINKLNKHKSADNMSNFSL